MDARFGEMLDTSLEERYRYYALVARLTPEERARKVTALGRATRELARAGIRQSRPQASAAEVEVDLVVRLYGREVADKLSRHLVNRRG
jgi:hypothetical protein